MFEKTTSDARPDTTTSDEPVSAGRTTMSDLRERIARATWISHRDRQLAQLGMKPSEYAADIPIPDWAYAIADAVIADLGMTEFRVEYPVPERWWATRVEPIEPIYG